MSFSSVKTPLSPVKKVLSESTLPGALPLTLPNDIAALKALLVAQHHAHAALLLNLDNAHAALLLDLDNAHTAQLAAIRQEAHDYVIRMLEQAVLARQRLFGASSEQLSAQSRLFDEAETLALLSTEAQDTAPIPAEVRASSPELDTGKPAVKPARGKRAPLPAQLERVDVVHDVPASARTCPCGTPMVEIGQDISEQLDIVPMQVRVLRHIRKRYACPTSAHAPITAPLPPQPLPKSNASADFLAMLLAVKFVDGLAAGAL